MVYIIRAMDSVFRNPVSLKKTGHVFSNNPPPIILHKDTCFDRAFADRYVRTLLDQGLPERITKVPGVFLCGGALRGIYFDSKYSDMDLWCDSQDKREVVETMLLQEGFNVMHESDMAKLFCRGEVKIHIVKKDGKTPLDIISDFDIDVCMFGTDFRHIWYPSHLDPPAKWGGKNRMMVVNPRGLRTYLRVIKHVEYGFGMPRSSFLDLFSVCMVEWIARRAAGTLGEIATLSDDY